MNLGDPDFIKFVMDALTVAEGGCGAVGNFSHLNHCAAARPGGYGVVEGTGGANVDQGKGCWDDFGHPPTATRCPLDSGSSNWGWREEIHQGFLATIGDM